eukprot:6021429-Alexandrium_andersonii.AAC.1
MRGRRTKHFLNWKALLAGLAALVACRPEPCTGPPMSWPVTEAGRAVVPDVLATRRLGFPGL